LTFFVFKIFLPEEGCEEIVVVEVGERVWSSHTNNWFDYHVGFVPDPQTKEEEVVVRAARPNCAICVEIERNLVESENMFNAALCREDVDVGAEPNRQRVFVERPVQQTAFK